MLKKIVLAALFALSLAASSKSFVLNTMDGKKIHIEVNDNGIKVKEYPDRVIILDFFGKNCPPCKAEMPILGRVQKKYSDKLQIIGLHVQAPLTLSEFSQITKRGVNFPVADYMNNNEEFIEYISSLTGWRGQIPYMLFFDSEGNYKGYHLGMMEESMIEKFVEQNYKKR